MHTIPYMHSSTFVFLPIFLRDGSPSDAGTTVSC